MYQATAQLNTEYYKNPACISALAQILASSPEIAVRQLAAVEMRKRVAQKSGDLWMQLPQDVRSQIKDQLPVLILAEQNKLVRHSAARVIAAAASIELTAGTWPQLLPWLHQSCTSAQVAHREVAIFILFTVLESIVEGFQEHLQSFFKLFEGLLNDQESIEVRITTVRALGVIAQYIDSDDKADIKSFQALLPGMIRILGQSIESGDEAGARQLFDVFETLLILVRSSNLGPHIAELASFLLQAGGNRSLDSEIRVLALNALNWTVQYKKSKIQSQALAGAILEGLMPITTEPEPTDSDDDAPCRVPLRIIDGLATNLPPTQYFSSPDANNRRGAMLALGVAVEGCSEFMTPLMSHIWPVIEVGLQDGDKSVRKATCIAVSCLCEWLEEECVAKHAVLVPVIMGLVHDPETQRAACTALDALLEISQDVIEQYLQLIMEQLAGLLDTAPITVKTVVTGALGSAAHASKEKFLPYFQPTMNKLQHFLVLTGEGEETELRGIAMDAVGTFAEAVGVDVFRPYFADMMKQAFQGAEMGSARLRECSFLFFGVMARVFGEEFAPYLPSVVPPLLQSCKQAEHGEDNVATSFASGSSATNAISVTDDIDGNGNPQLEIEDVDLDKMLEVNSAIAPCALELVNLLTHYYEGIRKSATDSLLEMVRTFYELSGAPDWAPGATVTVPLEQSVKELIGHSLKPLLEMYETEDHKTVVASLCLGLAETINKIGPAFIEGHLDAICSIAVQVLEQKALCQQDPDQDETEEAPEDQAEYDSVLISSAGDLVSSLANALGNDFAQAFSTFFPLISKYYKKNRSMSDRSSAIGCLAEIIAGMKASVTPSTEPLMDLFYRALSDPEPEVQSNACFAIGLLVEHSEIDLSPQYMHVLSALHPLFDVSPTDPSARLNAKDNAAGAVSRLIIRNTAAIPLDQVLPVLIGSLPLKTDYLENRPSLLPFMDKLLAVFAHVLDPSGPEQIGDETGAELVALIGILNAEDPGRIQAAGLSAFTGA
ncbi:hypothetical protein BDR07DRAFT_1452567 [Suillus spraguei]|nr:hypothetical protein BDR07DRAFT_1452567 [Suillus spraguei]